MMKIVCIALLVAMASASGSTIRMTSTLDSQIKMGNAVFNGYCASDVVPGFVQAVPANAGPHRWGNWGPLSVEITLKNVKVSCLGNAGMQPCATQINQADVEDAQFVCKFTGTAGVASNSAKVQATRYSETVAGESYVTSKVICTMPQRKDVDHTVVVSLEYHGEEIIEIPFVGKTGSDSITLTATDHCTEGSTANSCLNGATCQDEENGFTCICQDGFSLGTAGVCDECGIGKGYANGVCETCPHPTFNAVTTHNAGCTAQSCGEGYGVTSDNGNWNSNGADGSGTNCEQCGVGYYSPVGHGQCAVDPCFGNPCYNGGTCSRDAGSYTCSCVNDFTGSHCENDPTPVNECIYMGKKYGNQHWGCPSGYRMPHSNEWDRVQSCATGYVMGNHHGVAHTVGGCNCKWNGNWCGQPSIETFHNGRLCGDYYAHHVCVNN